MFEKIKSASAELSDRARRAKESLNKVKETSSKSLYAGKEKSQQIIEKHWPTIERVVTDGLLSIAEDKLKDEAFLQLSFEKIYELLPAAVRFVIARDKFISYCMGHRDPILLRLEASRSERELQYKLEVSGEDPHV